MVSADTKANLQQLIWSMDCEEDHHTAKQFSLENLKVNLEEDSDS
jgi:hypothetical protein